MRARGMQHAARRFGQVGVNKDSYLILDLLPAEYDSRVKAMEVRRDMHRVDARLCVCIRYFLHCLSLQV
jgi:hypothetical protein